MLILVSASTATQTPTSTPRRTGPALGPLTASTVSERNSSTRIDGSIGSPVTGSAAMSATTWPSTAALRRPVSRRHTSAAAALMSAVMMPVITLPLLWSMLTRSSANGAAMSS